MPYSTQLIHPAEIQVSRDIVTVQSRAKFLSNQYHKRVGKLFVILGIDLARTIAEMVHVVNNA